MCSIGTSLRFHFLLDLRVEGVRKLNLLSNIHPWDPVSGQERKGSNASQSVPTTVNTQLLPLLIFIDIVEEICTFKTKVNFTVEKRACLDQC